MAQSDVLSLAKLNLPVRFPAGKDEEGARILAGATTEAVNAFYRILRAGGECYSVVSDTLWTLSSEKDFRSWCADGMSGDAPVVRSLSFHKGKKTWNAVIPADAVAIALFCGQQTDGTPLPASPTAVAFMTAVEKITGGPAHYREYSDTTKASKDTPNLPCLSYGWLSTRIPADKSGNVPTAGAVVRSILAVAEKMGANVYCGASEATSGERKVFGAGVKAASEILVHVRPDTYFGLADQPTAKGRRANRRTAQDNVRPTDAQPAPDADPATADATPADSEPTSATADAGAAS